MGKALVICAVIVAVAIVIVALVVVGKRLIEGPGVKRRELKETQNELGRLRRAVAAIELETDTWSEVDSVLAAKIKTELRKYKEGRYSHD